MHNKKETILIFQGVSNLDTKWWVEYKLPLHLSKYKKVICFEYPQFKKLFSLLFGKIHLIEQQNPNLLIFHSFGLIPFGRSIIFINYFNHLLNYLLLKIVLAEKLIFTKAITFTPELMILRYFINNVPIYYYVTDNYTTLPSWNSTVKRIQYYFLESQLISICNKIIVASNSLLDLYNKLHPNVIYFNIPAEVTPYLNFNKISKFQPLHSVPHPIIGFIGSIYEWKIDLHLVNKIICKYPNISFVLIGILDFKNKNLLKRILNNRNVYYLGSKPLTQLPHYLVKFNICIIPYRTDKYGQSAYPVKIMEYLAMGKPVVTTALPAIKYLGDKGLIYWAKNSKEFIQLLQVAIKEKLTKSLYKHRINEAKKNDWNVKIKEFMKIVNG